MKISKFSQYLLKLDSTSKRLEIMDILTDLINELSPEEVDKAIYLASGYIAAPFKNIKFNMADKMLIRILEQTYASTKNPELSKIVEGLYKELGDLGDTAQKLAEQFNTNKTTTATIEDVYKQLYEISQIEGGGSQELKTKKTSVVLKELDPLSAKYIVRIILGTTRLGFTEITITEALANLLGNRDLKEAIEQKYSIHPDIGLITKVIKEKGLKGLDKIGIEPGVPVLCQRCQRVSGVEEAIEKMGTVWAEFKFDGTRVQMHIDKSKEMQKTQDLFSLGSDSGKEFLIKTYTRNLEETTNMYPDLVSAAKKFVNADSAILDGEAIGFNSETGAFLQFQDIMQRKRKHGVAEMAKEVPLKYFVFDILYLNGKSLTDKPLRERKRILQSIIKENDTIIVDEYKEVSTSEELYEYYEIAKEKNLEGVIAKKPDDVYQAGARSYSWVKIKRADEMLLRDSVDCVVLGYYVGKGVRNKFGIGGFLVGVYDETSEKFKTITKIGTGLTEEDWHKLKALCDKEKIKQQPLNVDMDKMFKPDVFVQPKIVVEIGADEISASPSHTAGYALRFPRLIKFREDKSATQITTVNEIELMYRNQKRGTY